MWTTPDDGPSEKENHLDDRTWIPLTRASFYSIFTSPSWLSVYEALHGWREDSLQLKWHLIKKRVKITFIHFWWRSKWPANFSTNSGGTVFGWGGHSASWVSQRVRITFLHFRCTVTTTEVGLHYLLHHLPMTWCHPRATLPSSQVASSLPSLRCIIPLAWMGTRWPVWTPATNHEAIMNLSHYCDISTFSFLFLRITVFESCSKKSLLFS